MTTVIVTIELADLYGLSADQFIHDLGEFLTARDEVDKVTIKTKDDKA